MFGGSNDWEAPLWSLSLRSVYTAEYRAFLRRLRLARGEAGLTQKDVARAVRRAG